MQHGSLPGYGFTLSLCLSVQDTYQTSTHHPTSLQSVSGIKLKVKAKEGESRTEDIVSRYGKAAFYNKDCREKKEMEIKYC